MKGIKHIVRLFAVTMALVLSCGLAAAVSAAEVSTAYPLSGLAGTGYAEVGFYSVERRADNVYHVHDETEGRPAASATNPASMFVVVGTEKAILFDLGNNRTTQEDYKNWRADLRTIVDYLRGSLPLEIVVTHNHGDHVGQIHAFPGVTAYMPADEFPNGDMPDRYTPYDEGDVFDLGGGYEFEAMYLKGHTIGSMVLIDEEHHILVTGDAMGSAHIWLFSPAAVEGWVADAERFMARVGDWDDAVLLMGHDWQRWEHPEKNDNLTIQFFRDMLKAGQDLLENRLVGVEYASMQAQAPRVAYEFNASQGEGRPAYIDVPVPRGVNPITFKSTGFGNGDYIALTQDVPGPSSVTLIHGGNIQSMYLIMDGEEALLIDTDNDYGGALTDFVYGLIGNRNLSLYITHDHGDHTGQIGYFREGTTVYWPEGANISETVQTRLEGKNLVKVPYGEELTLVGRTFEIIRMDVHSTGGSMLLDRENRLLFAGDALGTMTTTGGAWANNGTPESILEEFEYFKEEFDGTYDRIYTGHNAYWVGTNYIDNVIAACEALLEFGLDATVYNLDQNRPGALQVMVLNGELVTSDKAEYGNPGTLTYDEEYGSASLDTTQNFLLGYLIEKFEAAEKPSGYAAKEYNEAVAAFKLPGNKNTWDADAATKHDAMVKLEAALKALEN